MEQFTNHELIISSLPKHEEVAINSIHSAYWHVIAINLAISFLVIGGILTTVLFLIQPLRPHTWFIIALYTLFMVASVVVQRLAFGKRGYTLRQHDLIYRRGLLATITTVIPFNRIQHVALNEGFLSRYYGLAQLQLFTAGGSSSDMRISGLAKDEAERVKDLILRQITHDETNQTKNFNSEATHGE